MDIEFDFKGDPIGGVITNCKYTLYIAPDKDWKQLGIYPPLFGLIGYFKF